MRHTDHKQRGILELLRDRGCNHGIGLKIDGRSSFVHQDERVLLEQSPRQTQQLTLSGTEVLSLLRHFRVQVLEDIGIHFFTIGWDDGLARQKTCAFQGVKDLVVLVLIKRVQSAAQRAGEDSLADMSV